MSKIRLSCFHCSAKLEVDTKHIGRKGKCPKCGTKNTIPSPEDTIEESIMTIFKDMEDEEDEEEFEKEQGE